MKSKASMLCTAIAAAMSLTASAYQTNAWQNASGGKWSVASNWSLGRVPTYDDWVALPSLSGNYAIEVDGDFQVRCVRLENTGAQTVTLTGTGSVTSGGNDCYVRDKRALVLDGPSFVMTKANFMLYGPLTVKGGSSLRCVSATLWMTNPELHVESGSSATFAESIGVRAATAVIDVNGGAIECKCITRASTYTNCGAIRVSNGGTLAMQTFDLDDRSSVSLTDGLISVSVAITMAGNVNLTLTGGTLVLPEGRVPQAFIDAVDGATVRYVAPTRFVAGPVTDRTVLETLGGDVLVVTGDSNAAVDLFQSNAQLDHEVEVDGALIVTNGLVNFARRGTLGGDYPVHVKGFRISSLWSVPAIRFPEIVVGASYPFLADEGCLNTFCLEGPTTLRATADMDVPSVADTVVMASGDFVVDTRDFNDSSAVHRMVLNGFGAKDAASLTVRGGGELLFRQAHSGSPFSKIEVESGTTLTLLDLGQDTTFGALHADELVLGPNAVLNIPAGSNSVRAAKWTVDPSATVNILLREGLSTEAKGLMYDFSGEYRIPEGQIRLVGDAAAVAGWGLNPAAGTWSITNAFADLTLEEGFEWTGAGIKTYTMFADPTNWNAGGVLPYEKDDYVFGASNATTQIDFYRVYRASDNTRNGSTVHSIRFRNTATKTFCIYDRQMTLALTGDYDLAGVKSYSTVPQSFSNSLRAVSCISIYAAEGPVVCEPIENFNIKSDAGNAYKVRTCGDVRFGKTISVPRADFCAVQESLAHLSGGTRFTVLNGGNITYTNQTIAFTVPYAGFRVNGGGALTFSNGGLVDSYRWNAAGAYGAKNTVDGTMNINVPFIGGNDHAFGGSGTLNLMSVTPMQNTQSYANANRSRVSFGDTLNVNLSHDWTTAAAGADYPLTIKAFGTPTIHLAADWKYGPDAGFESAMDAKWRAAEVAKGATLTVDAGGHTATFADPVGGKGTLAITNGVLVTSGGVADTLGIVAKADGVYEWSAAQSLRSVACENGGVLRFAAFDQPLTVKEGVDLDALSLSCPANLGAGSPRWHTVLVSEAGFTGGLGSVPHPFVARIAETESGWALQLRHVVGTAISVR